MKTHKITVKTQAGTVHTFHIQEVADRRDSFRLVTAAGRPAPANMQVMDGRDIKIHFFDGVQIDQGMVSTLNLSGAHPSYPIGTIV